MYYVEFYLVEPCAHYKTQHKKLVNPLNKMMLCLYFHPSIRAPHGQNGIRIHFIYQIVLILKLNFVD